MREQYEYAGFQYFVERRDGKPVKMEPVPGQHSSASKEKHRRAALECLLADEKRNWERETAK